MRPFDDTTLNTERLILAPLGIEDAEEMAVVLADERLHEFIGGHPATFDDLRTRYRKLVAGAPRPDETWFNWIARDRSDGRAVGTAQATVVDHAAARTAYDAWVIGVPWKNRGFASEAARAIVDWLRAHDVETSSPTSIPTIGRPPSSPPAPALSRPTSPSTANKFGERPRQADPSPTWEGAAAVRPDPRSKRLRAVSTSTSRRREAEIGRRRWRIRSRSPPRVVIVVALSAQAGRPLGICLPGPRVGPTIPRLALVAARPPPPPSRAVHRGCPTSTGRAPGVAGRPLLRPRPRRAH